MFPTWTMTATLTSFQHRKMTIPLRGTKTTVLLILLGQRNPTSTDKRAGEGRLGYVADMDDDGDLDIVSASEEDDTIAWYENDGGGNPSWSASDIDTNADGAYSVYVADMDGDGDLDIVSASDLDDTIAWYENDGGC